jgi:hypothetical protein
MENPKVWLVLGAEEGLGRSAVRYLVASKQMVLTIDPQITPLEMAIDMAARCGAVDFIINNSNYGLFSQKQPDITGSIATTMALLKGLTPYLRREPKGSIINIPPQLCLATLADPLEGDKLLQAMELFLNQLHRELLTLDCHLRFLEPGERLA